MSRTIERLGPYRLLEEIGRGGAGVVYRAESVENGARVAVKTLRAVDPVEVEALRREAHTLRRIRHPGVVAVIDEGVERGLPWYAMELVEGSSLEARWREAGADEPRRLSETLRVVRRLCAALAFVHGEGVVHRDLKPSNVLIRPDGRPVLFDFGFLSHFGGRSGREVLEIGGEVLGTVAYMAPEQARGEYVDARADLYSLGCILYEAATGAPPFTGHTAGEILIQHLRDAPVAPSRRRSDVPATLDRLILRLLEKDPRRRLGYARDVGAALAAFAPEDGDHDDGPPAAPYLYRPAFAGRADQLDLIAGRLRTLAEGRGACVLIAGESGVGKTRLAMEVTRAAASRGVLVVTGECVPLEGQTGSSMKGSPLHPWRPLLRAIADHCRQHGAATTEAVFGRRGPVLAEYEPELATLPGVAEQAAPAALPAQAARARVLKDLEETIVAFAREKRLLVVLDDLQWADELSLAFLEAMAGPRLERAPVLVIGAYRSEEAPDAVLRLHRASRAARLELDRMDAAAVGTMISDMLAMPAPPEPLVRFLARESEGNPFFVSEYLHTAVEARLLGRSSDGAWRVVASGQVGETAFRSLALPHKLQDLVGHRLDRLSATARTVLEAAAVLGREFELALAAELARLDEAARTDAVRQLLARHVVEEAGGGRYRFAHDKLREVANARIGAARAASLHRSAAAALEAQWTGDDDRAEHSAELAHHWTAAGDDERALRYLGLAGERALRTGAHAEAHGLLGRALEMDERTGRRVGTLQRARWLRMLGEACFGIGDFEGSLRRTAAALGALGARVPRGRGGWVAALLTEITRQTVGRFLPERARNGAPREEWVEAAAAAGQLANTYYYRRDLLRGVCSSLRCVNLAERAGRPERATLAYGQLGFIAGGARLHRLARGFFERAEALQGDGADPSSFGSSLYFDAMYHTGLGRCEEGVEIGDRAVELLEGIDNHQEAEIARTIVANALYYQGRFRDAEARCRTMLSSAQARSNPQHAAWGLFLSGRSLAALGEVSQAIDLLEQGREILLPLDDLVSVVMCEGSLARALAMAERWQRCRQIAAELSRRILAQRPIPLPQGVDGYSALADVLYRLCEESADAPERRRAEAAARQACTDLGRFARLFPLALPAALRSRARLAWRGGRPARALSLAKRSLGAAEELRMPYERALTHLEVAGSPAPAEERARHLAAARALFVELGCAGHLGEIERLVSEATTR